MVLQGVKKEVQNQAVTLVERLKYIWRPEVEVTRMRFLQFLC